MVSFSCENCGDVLTKKKLDPHRNRCRGATFTCIDCMVTFWGTDYRAHTTCMTEEQKTHGALYKLKKAKTSATADTTADPSTATPATSNKMAHAAYVEDVNDELGDWRDYEDKSDEDNQSAGDLPPEAPTPPPADEGPVNVNVFDYMVGQATPTASHLSLPQTGRVQLSEDTQLVRFDHEANAILDPFGEMDEDAMVQYGTGPVPTSFETPAPKGMRKTAKDGDREVKKDKKRKRLQIETDQIMTDAPPVLHSGLTGGLGKLMSRPHAFPPSPDYSGGDMADTPASPLKKTKHSKHSKPSRTETIGNSIMAMISGNSKPTKVKTKKRKSSSTSGTTKKHRHRLEAPEKQKLLEFTPSKDGGEKKDGSGEAANQMVVYKPRAEHFLSFVNKGPESERGCSLNKVLKRYHRERNASGQGVGKMFEEKELFRSLRLRKNERGEIVLFTV